MKRMLITLVSVLGIALTATLGAGAKSNDDTLTGAGSSFVAPLVSVWTADYAGKTGVHIAYSPVGSGAGIAAITARQVDFGASDAPLSPEQFGACNGCLQIPWALSATAIIYNLPNVPNNLKLTGRIISDIYLGNITEWNDAKIQAAMEQEDEKHVALKAAIPVYIVYFTAWPRADGGVDSWPDVYGYDARQADKLH